MRVALAGGIGMDDAWLGTGMGVVRHSGLARQEIEPLWPQHEVERLAAHGIAQPIWQHCVFDWAVFGRGGHDEFLKERLPVTVTSEEPMRCASAHLVAECW
jgi:hypothetical protein